MAGLAFDLAPDPDERDDEQEDDDDDDDGEGDDEQGDDDDPEARAPARAPQPLEPVARVPVAATASIVPPLAPRPAPPSGIKAKFSRDPRSRAFSIHDERVTKLTVLDRHGHRLLLLTPPFPDPIESWIATTYGVGKYRVVLRGDAGHIGSRVLTVAGEGGETLAFTAPEPAPLVNGHASAPMAARSSGDAVAAAAASIPAGMDWRTALITTGIPLLASVISAGFAALASRPEPRSELQTLTEVAKILQVPTSERAELFREGMKLYSSVAETRGERHEGGDGLNIREILAGIGDIVQTMRGTATTGTSPMLSPGPAPPVPAPGPAPNAAATDNEVGAAYVEKLLVTEIHRAVARADSPECLVVLIDSYLPPIIVSWLETTPIDEVLVEFPKRFPKYSEYLQGEQVQTFLRSALTMLREDAEEAADVPPAGAVVASS